MMWFGTIGILPWKEGLDEKRSMLQISFKVDWYSFVGKSHKIFLSKAGPIVPSFLLALFQHEFSEITNEKFWNLDLN